MSLVTRLCQWRGDQWSWGRGINVRALYGVAIDRFVFIIRYPHSDNHLSGFVGLKQAEGRLIKVEVLLQSSPLL